MQAITSTIFLTLLVLKNDFKNLQTAKEPNASDNKYVNEYSEESFIN